MAGQYLILVFVFFLAFAAIKDAMSFTIPNWLNASIALTFPLAAAFLGMGWMEFGLHLAVGAGALVIGM
ncbi:MAG TPA: peptidase, partial [Alphaproteobacteria bacterium]|nr:peptidase [Alphaproteobacteria bacterium]